MRLPIRSTGLACVFTVLFFLASFQQAEASTTYTIDPTTLSLAACQGGACYIVLSTPPPQNRSGNYIYTYFDSTGYYQSLYATALMAVGTGKSVRVVFSQASGSGSQCNVAVLGVYK